MTNPYGWWLPLNASKNLGIDALISVTHAFMGIVFLGWLGYLIYCLVRFRARPGVPAYRPEKNFRFPLYSEVVIVVVEVVLLVFVSSPIWFSYRENLPPEDKSLVVNVTAEQFAWNFHYAGKDGKFGRLRSEFIDGNNPLGLDRSDPDGRDDVTTVNEMHVEVGKPTIVHLAAKDVIHNFFIPVLRVKQDAIPGMTVPLWFQAVKTGEFEIGCAQLCGLAHYRMKARLLIDSPAEWHAWMAAQERELENGAP